MLINVVEQTLFMFLVLSNPDISNQQNIIKTKLGKLTKAAYSVSDPDKRLAKIQRLVVELKVELDKLDEMVDGN